MADCNDWVVRISPVLHEGMWERVTISYIGVREEREDHFSPLFWNSYGL